ncbi:unnamed protein product, partial [Mesorhabditis belari]|uniref:F-box domain-containing protein n=1 Tax=Mesorhabditis belari TaxID=2138241 RepID=A0AAF3FAR2_9BILA
MFPLNSLPLISKESILSAISADESLKLLLVNKEIREYILNNGPFTGKIKLIKLLAFKYWISDEQIRLTDFHVTVCDRGPDELNAQGVHRWDPSENEMPQVNCRQLSRTKPKAMEITLCSAREIPGENPSLFQFLPNVKAVHDLSVNTDKLSTLTLLLSHFCPQVEKELGITVESGASLESKEMQSTEKFLEKSLQICKQIEFFNPLPNFYDLLTKTGLEFITIFPRDWENFREALAICVTRGIPSRNPVATMFLRWENIGEVIEENRYEELMGNLLDFGFEVTEFDAQIWINRDRYKLRNEKDWSKKWIKEAYERMEGKFFKKIVDRRAIHCFVFFSEQLGIILTLKCG